MRTLSSWCVLVIVAAALSSSSPAAAADGCATAAPPASFLGVVYDTEERSEGKPREDFVLDVDNLELFLSQLRSSYCIPSDRAEILAFEPGFERNGRSYEPGTEANVKDRLSRFGETTPSDGTFFFLLSSHGLAGPSSCGGARRVGSFSGLGRGLLDGQDGTFHDCELGAALNTDFAPQVRMAVYVDCSFCGGFSDSLTAVSGTVPDGSVPTPSGILGPNRVVITGCAITTECFGGPDGARMFGFMVDTLSVGACDGWTAPLFPAFQGVNVPTRDGERDGRCTASEWHFAAVQAAYESGDLIAIQQQFRIKYGFSSVDEDIVWAQ